MGRFFMQLAGKDKLTDTVISVLDVTAPEMGDIVAGTLEALLIAAGRETVPETTAASAKGSLRVILHFDREVPTVERHSPGNFRNFLSEAVGGAARWC